jgi:hypothetical protein
MIPVYTLYNLYFNTIQSLLEPLRYDIHFQQSSRMQNKHTKISSISIPKKLTEKEVRKAIPFIIVSKTKVI